MCLVIHIGGKRRIIRCFKAECKNFYFDIYFDGVVLRRSVFRFYGVLYAVCNIGKIVFGFAAFLFDRTDKELCFVAYFEGSFQFCFIRSGRNFYRYAMSFFVNDSFYFVFG